MMTVLVKRMEATAVPSTEERAAGEGHVEFQVGGRELGSGVGNWGATDGLGWTKTSANERE